MASSSYKVIQRDNQNATGTHNGNVHNGNVHNGDVYNGNVHKGDVYSGDVYHGNVHKGDVHTGDVHNYNRNMNDPSDPRNVIKGTHNQIKKEWEEEGPCEWLLKKSEFEECIDQKRPSSVLWIHGNPGCGKSTLMSRVIDYISEPGRNGLVHLMYFYIGFNTGDDNWKSMLLTFWDQVMADTRGYEARLNSFGKHDETAQVRDDLLRLLAKYRRPVYVVIDALDQLSGKERSVVIAGLRDLAKDAVKCSVCIIIIISARDNDDLEKFAVERTLTIKVEPRDTAGDMKQYLKEKLKSDLLPDDNMSPREREELQQTVSDTLMKHADGMFLWVTLQASNICDEDTPDAVKAALKPENLTLPEEINKIYQDYVEGFEVSSQRTHGQFALRVTALLAHGKGSFPKEGLMMAITLNTVDSQPPEDLKDNLKTNPGKFVQFCKHLVVINEELGVVRFIHQTVYDFFKSYKEPQRYALIAKLSLSYLGSPSFPAEFLSRIHDHERGMLQEHLRAHPFLAFASCSWADSVKNRPGSEESRAILEELFKRLCITRNRKREDSSEAHDDEDRIALSFQVYLLVSRKPLVRGVCQEHVFSYFHLVNFLKTFKDNGWLDLRKVDDDGLTAIHWAIKSGAEMMDQTGSETRSVVMMLINYGGEVHTKDLKGRTPLYYAARFGKLDVVKLLLARNAKVDARSDECGTALQAASFRDHATYPDHIEMTKELLKAGASANSQSESGTPLHAIAWVGCHDCAKMMFDRKMTSFLKRPRKNVYGGHFGTALHAAAFSGHVQIVQLLLNKGFNAKKMHSTYGSTLAAAAAGCWQDGSDTSKFAQIFRLLIEHRVKVDAQGGLYVTALHASASFGHRDLVELLLDNNADATIIGPAGTAYQAAVNSEHQEIIDLFQEKRPNIQFNEGADGTATATQHRRVQDAYKPQIGIWLVLLRITLETSGVKRMESNIKVVEGFFNQAITQRQNTILERLAYAGESVFEGVISLAGKSSKEGNPSTVSKWSIRRKTASTWGKLFDFSRFNRSADITRNTGIKRRPSHNQNEISDQILDLLTQAAVRILEFAFLSNNKEAITILAQSWTRALYNVRSKGVQGKHTLAFLLRNRAAQLKEILVDDGSDGPDGSGQAKKRMEQTVGFHGAKRLAEVGVELLITAFREGQNHRPLATALANLWVGALEDIDQLGKEHGNDISSLVKVFAARFQAAVDASDATTVKCLADAGMEIIQITVLRNRERLTHVLAWYMTEKWTAAIKGREASPIDELVKERRQEYRDSIKNDRHVEALALVGALTELFHTALSRGYEEVAQKLSEVFVAESEWTFSNLIIPIPPPTGTQQDRSIRFAEPNSKEEPQHTPLDLMVYVDAFASIIFTAKGKDHVTLLDPLLRETLKAINGMSVESQQALETTMRQQVERIRSLETQSNTKGPSTTLRLDFQLRRIWSTVLCLLGLVLQDSTAEDQPPSSLVSIGRILLDLMRSQAVSEQDIVVVQYLADAQTNESQS